jgi:2,5-diketo-D-gluconate reductase A
MDSTIELHSGNIIPVMGLGTWQMTVDTANTVLYALELGYRLIDTAWDYYTQPAIGEAINASGLPRSELFIETKVEETDDAFEASHEYVKEMNLEYADLILIHRPPEKGPGIDLWEGLIKARSHGLARDIGVSNYSISQIEQLISATGEVPVVQQIEWSPFGHSRSMRQYCDRNAIVIQAYSPLTRTKRLGDETLSRIAERYHKTPAQILIRWNLQRGTLPIPKANQKPHLEENLDVFDFEIGQRDMEVLNGLNERYSSLGTLPYE